MRGGVPRRRPTAPVPRSVENPLGTDLANVHGTLAVLVGRQGRRRAPRGVGVVEQRVRRRRAAAHPGDGAARAPLAVRGVEGRGRAVLPRLPRALRARDGLAALLQRLRPPPAPELGIRGGDPVVHRRAADGCEADRARRRPPDPRLHLRRPTPWPATLLRRRRRRSAAPAAPTTSRRARRTRCSTCSTVLGRILEVEPDPEFTADRAPATSARRRPIRRRRARDLDFRCGVDLEDGLRRTVEWFA